MKGGFAFFWGKEPTLAGGSDRTDLIKCIRHIYKFDFYNLS